MRTSEKEFDHELALLLRDNPKFQEWFLGKTRFANRPSKCILSRSDHPWTTVTIEVKNAATGKTESIRRQGETDILVVFEDDSGERFALHIENKIAGGKFTKHQPEGYPKRAEKWVGQEKYGNYTEWETILVAPVEFKERLSEQASRFGVYISHEEIAEHISSFGTYYVSTARRQTLGGKA